MTDEELRQLIEANAKAISTNSGSIEQLTKDIDSLREESKDLSTRFGYYQQSTQMIVNLAFSLIASATVSVFITAILKR